MREDTVRVFISAALAAFWVYTKQLVVPLVILLIVMTADYISGVIAAYKADQLSSRVGILGILKKISYLFLVVVGCVMDYLVGVVGGNLEGIGIDLMPIGMVVICWLIINELISILENVARTGGPVPSWLIGWVTHLKAAAESKIPGASGSAAAAAPEGKHERRA